MLKLVDITTKGKVRITLPSSMKYPFKQLLEMFMNDRVEWKLNVNTAPRLINIALINEVYCKHHMQLSMLNGEAKLLLTLAQAHAFWMLCQEYDQVALVDAGMGGILMQLHQKLS
jgi:hypothetical protein